jgi:hypothetical protein
MDRSYIDEAERAREQARLGQELAEVKLRALERAKPKSPLESSFTDKSGRPMTIRTWESGDQASIRAYDTGKVQVLECVNPGQAGYANATLERSAGS